MPTDGRTALNLALAQIAQGDWAGARGDADGAPGDDRAEPIAAWPLRWPAIP